MTVPAEPLCLILSNVPDQGVADAIACALVEERLAACVNILGACRSVYRWHGAVERADEMTLLVKTTVGRHDACVQRLAALHPYEVPEIITLATQAVWPSYAQWATAGTSAGS